MKKNGYTLIELIISLSIIAILSVGIVVTYQYFKRDTETETAAQKIIASLREVQSRALASQDNSTWGIHLGRNSYVIFSGTYDQTNPKNETIVLGTSVVIDNISLHNSVNEIIFSKLTGATENYGQFDVVSIVSGSAKTITVTKEGKITGP